MSDICNVDNLMAFADKLDDLSNASEVKSVLKYSGVSKQFGKEAVKYTKYASEFADSISTTSDKVGGLTTLLQKAGGALAAFATTPVGFLTIAGASIVAIAAATSETINYEEALEQSMGSIEKAQKSASTLQAINQELATTRQRILELYKLKNSGSISPIEEKELKNLEKYKDQLLQDDSHHLYFF